MESRIFIFGATSESESKKSYKTIIRYARKKISSKKKKARARKREPCLKQEGYDTMKKLL